MGLAALTQGPETSFLLGGRWHSPCLRGAATFPSDLAQAEQGPGWGPDHHANLALGLSYKTQAQL